MKEDNQKVEFTDMVSTRTAQIKHYRDMNLYRTHDEGAPCEICAFTDAAYPKLPAAPVEWPRDMRESCERILHTNNDQLLRDTAKYVARVILERVDTLPVPKPGFQPR